MTILAVAVVIIVLLMLFRKKRRRSSRYHLDDQGVRVSSKLIGRKETVRPATYCEDCGRPKALCRRDQARDTHAEGMKGPRKDRYGRS